jgi:hypothetical protein
MVHIWRVALYDYLQASTSNVERTLVEQDGIVYVELEPGVWMDFTRPEVSKGPDTTRLVKPW